MHVRPNVKTFLVPASEATARVDVPQAFKSFCLQKLPAKSARPTVNLMRKFFHKTLMRLTKDERALKEMMTALDGHSTKTIDRHYALREPEDDVVLAKVLVHNVLGETSKFPKAGEISDVDCDALVDAFEITDQQQVADEEPEEDVHLEWWPLGELFGVRPPLPALAHEPEAPVEEALVAWAASEERGEKEGERGEGQKAKVERKDKNEQKEKVEKVEKKGKKVKVEKKEKKEHKEQKEKREEKKEEEEVGLPDNKKPRLEQASSSTGEVHRGRRSPFTEEQKAWIEAKQWGWGRSVPPAFLMGEWLRMGIVEGILSPDTLRDQVRHVCRALVDKMATMEE